MSHIFVSYAHEDADFVNKLIIDLESRGIRAWYDRRMEAGSVSRQIDVALDMAYAVVVVLSPPAVASDYVEGEWQKAIILKKTQNKKIIPVLCQPCDVPSGLSSYKRVEFIEGDYNANLDQLAQFLKPDAAFTPPDDIQRVHIDTLKLSDKVSLPLVYVPPGHFLMGPNKLRTPAYGYYIGQTPVTVEQYKLFTKDDGYVNQNYWTKRSWYLGCQLSSPGDEWLEEVFRKADHPQVMVSWHEAIAYTRWLSVITGRYVQLTSELEWEKAARGIDGRVYPWGAEPPSHVFCNIDDEIGHTTPVGHYKAGAAPYGCMDMAGNVLEWCRNTFGSYPYDPNDGRESLEEVWERVLRGGSWASRPHEATSYHQQLRFPMARSDQIGFRVSVRV